MITGYTSHKLDLVRTYSLTNPYQIGVNGVTNITYDPTSLTGITSISYTIDNINYVTNLPSLVTTFFTYYSGYDFEPYIIFPNKQNTFDIKEEAKMGLVFPPKVNNELFIERMNVAIFERQSRLSEITTLQGLIEYRNGYYNVTQTT